MPVRSIVTPKLVSPLLSAVAIVAAGPATAVAQSVPTALLRVGDDLAGDPATYTVQAIHGPVANTTGGFAAVVETGNWTGNRTSLVWGTTGGNLPGVLRTEGGPFLSPAGREVAFEPAIGMSVNGRLAFVNILMPVPPQDPPLRNRSALAVTGAAMLVEGDTALGAEDMLQVPCFWTFFARPTVTAAGEPYWLGGVTHAPGGLTQTQGLFKGNKGEPVLLGGQAIAGASEPLREKDPVGVNFDVAPGNPHVIAQAFLASSAADDEIIVYDGAVLVIGGQKVREGAAVAAAGAEPSDQWRRFGFVEATGDGSYMLTASVSPVSSSDEVVIRDGTILQREGGSYDGQVVSGPIRAAAMNESGDVAVIWRIESGTAEALYLNGLIVARTWDAVDFDGDGQPDPDARLSRFTGRGALTVSGRDASGNVRLYFTGYVDGDMTSTTADDSEALLVLTAAAGAPAPLMSDFDADGQVLAADFDAFHHALEASDPSADLNGDGEANAMDAVIFQEAFFAGR